MERTESTQTTPDSLPDIKALGPGPRRERKQPTTAKPLGDSPTSGDSDPGAAGGAQTAVMERPRKRPGQKGMLTKEIALKICQRVARGVPLAHAAESIGIKRHTADIWRSRGEDEKGTIYALFARWLQKARAKAVARRVRQIDDAAVKGTWTAAAWHLERTAPAEFGLKKHVEHSGQVNHAHAVSIAYVNCDTLQPGELAQLMNLSGRILEQPAIETTAVPVANIEHKPDAQ